MKRIPIALAVLVSLVLAGCEETTPTGPPPPTEPPRSYVGSWTGTTIYPSGQQGTVSLDVQENHAFRAVVVMPARRLTVASANSSSERQTWMALSGITVDDGTKAKLTITKAERDKRALTGSELAPYTNCAITGTIGDDFHLDAMTGLAQCVSTNEIMSPTGPPRVSEPVDAEPAALQGAWRLDTASAEYIRGVGLPRLDTIYLSFSRGEIAVDFRIHSVTYPDPPPGEEEQHPESKIAMFRVRGSLTVTPTAIVDWDLISFETCQLLTGDETCVDFLAGSSGRRALLDSVFDRWLSIHYVIQDDGEHLQIVLDFVFEESPGIETTRRGVSLGFDRF